jgi:hypothetical protein
MQRDQTKKRSFALDFSNLLLTLMAENQILLRNAGDG